MYCTAPLSPRNGRLRSSHDDDDDDDDNDDDTMVPIDTVCTMSGRTLQNPAIVIIMTVYLSVTLVY